MKACVLHKKGDQPIPLEYLQIVGKNNPRGFGYALIKPDNSLEMQRLPGAVDILKLFDLQKTFNRPSFFFFADMPSNYMEVDLQPYTIVTAKGGQDRIAAFLEGDFSKFADKSGHVDAYSAFEKHLQPKIDQLMTLTNGDLKIVHEQLSTPLFASEMEMFLGDTGSVVLAFVDGLPDIKYTKSKSQRDFSEWGWTSNTYGFGRSRLESAGSLIDGLKNALSSKSADVKSGLLPIADPTKIEFYLKNFQRVTPPATLKRNKHIRAWYIKNAGYSPPNAVEERPGIYSLDDRAKADRQLKEYFRKTGTTPSADTAIASAMALSKERSEPAPVVEPEPVVAPDLSPDKQVEAPQAPQPLTARDRLLARKAARSSQERNKEAEAAVETAEKAFHKDTSVHHVDDKGIHHISSADRPNLIDIEDLPIVPAETKERVLDLVRKFASSDGEPIDDPADFPKDLEKLPNAFEIMGVKHPSATFRWKFARFKLLASSEPEFGALLAMGYRNALMDTMGTVSELIDEIESLKVKAKPTLSLEERLAARRA